MNSNELDEAQGYIDALHAKKRRNLIIGVVIAVILALLLVPRVLSLFDGPEYLDEETVLARIPALALTQAEKELADTILESETFRSALTYEATGVTAFSIEEVGDIIAPILPEDAVIEQIGVQGAVIYIDYSTRDLRAILEYVDADRSGTVDRVSKAVKAEDGVYCLLYTVSTEQIQYSLGQDWTE